MAAGNGFIDYVPDTRYGTTTTSSLTEYCWAQKFLLPEGDFEISEIGMYLSADAGFSTKFHYGIFTDDSVNTCPGTLVSNSDEGEFTHNTAVITKIGHSYSVKPLLTGAVGGTYYWLAIYSGDQYANLDQKVVVGSTSNIVHSDFGITYPTWPTDTQWHTHTHYSTIDWSLYAFYQATSVGSKIMVGSMINIG